MHLQYTTLPNPHEQYHSHITLLFHFRFLGFGAKPQYNFTNTYKNNKKENKRAQQATYITGLYYQISFTRRRSLRVNKNVNQDTSTRFLDSFDFNFSFKEKLNISYVVRRAHRAFVSFFKRNSS